MRNSTKIAIAFVVGAAIGSTGMYFYVRDKFARLANEEIASVLETAVRGRRRDIAKVDENGMPYKEQTEGKVLVMRKDRYQKLVRNYNGISTPDNPDPAETEHPTEDEVREYEEMSEEANQKVLDGEGPYIISLEEFSEEMSQHDKLTIYYYANDDVLADDCEEIITDVEGTIGRDNLDALCDDCNVFYVRNERTSTDYEVIGLPKSYSETVLGYKPVKRVPSHKPIRGEGDES